MEHAVSFPTSMLKGHFRSPDGELTQRTELTTDQRQLLATLGVPEPPRFAHITPAARPNA